MLSQPLSLQPDFEEISLNPYSYIFVDSSQSLGIEALILERQRFTQAKELISPLRKFEGAHIWLSWNLLNASNKPLKSYLTTLADPLYWELFIIYESGEIDSMTSGALIPPTQRPFSYKRPVFPIEIPAESQVGIYMKMPSLDYYPDPLLLMNPTQFQIRSFNSTLFFGIFQGFLVLELLFSLTLLLVLGGRLNLFFFLYVAGTALLFFLYSGLMQMTWFPNFALGHYAQFSWVVVQSVLFLQFVLAYFAEQKLIRFPNRIYWGYLVLSGMAVISILLHPWLLTQGIDIEVYSPMVMLQIALISLYCFGMIAQFTYQVPSIPNLLFAAAFSGLIFGGVVSVFVRNGYLNLGISGEFLFPFALFTELIFLSILLGYRMIEILRHRSTLAFQVEAQEKELEQAAQLKVALEEKELLLQEIHHRVKNNLQVISSLLKLQSRSIDDPKAQKAMKEGSNRAISMALIHQNLYQRDNWVGVSSQHYIRKLVESLVNSYQVHAAHIDIQTDIEDLTLDVDTSIPLGLILNELITNALKYAFKPADKGRIRLSLQQIGPNLELTVSDNGVGLPKGFSLEHSDSMGYRIVTAFVKKLMAQIELQDARPGTQIRLTIPHLSQGR